MTFEGHFFLSTVLFVNCLYLVVLCVRVFWLHTWTLYVCLKTEDTQELELQILANHHEVLESKLVLLLEQDLFLNTKPPLGVWSFFFFFFKHIEYIDQLLTLKFLMKLLAIMSLRILCKLCLLDPLENTPGTLLWWASQCEDTFPSASLHLCLAYLFLLMVLFYLTHSKLVTCLLATYSEASGSEFVVIFRKRVWFHVCFPVTIVTGMGRPWWAGPGSLSISTARVREGNFNWQHHQHHNRSEEKRKSLPELSRERTGELDRKNAHLPHSK